MGVDFEIIAGTYEEYLLGYMFSSKNKTLTQSFASHDHCSSIRCLATCDKYLASGAGDDRIIVYDLKARKEQCMLTQHESTITSLAFTKNHSHIISASQDGSLAIVRVGNWQLEKLWAKAHKEGMILDIALHSSGKLALTLGSDGKIHTWNLVKGREAYIINLKTKCKDPKSLEKILFAPDDTRFLIYGGKYTEIWSIDIGGVVNVIEHDEKVTACVWLDNDTLVIGYEDGNLTTLDIESSEKTKVQKAHDGRVKVIRSHEGFIVTASSNGEIKVWSRKLKELCAVTTGCRVTCLSICEWLGKLKKEEPNEAEPEVEVLTRKPSRGVVIVEMEDDSAQEEEEIEIPAKKMKKQLEPTKQKKKAKTAILELENTTTKEVKKHTRKMKKPTAENKFDKVKTKKKRASK